MSVEAIPRNKEQTHLIENISDVIMNAFSRVKHKDPKFLEIKERSKLLEGNLLQIERNHSKIVKAETNISLSLQSMGEGIASLAFMETQMANSLSGFGSRLENFAGYLKTKALREVLV
jgi:sorting nexin-4